MLSLQLKPMNMNEEVNIRENIIKLAQNINIQGEKENIIKLIFVKTQKHTVKYMSFDFNWIIKPDFDIVQDALIKLSSIITTLKMYTFKDTYSKIVVDHIISLNKILKDGLIAHGCFQPPYKIDSPTTTDTILEIADQINKNFLVCTKPINIKNNLI